MADDGGSRSAPREGGELMHQKSIVMHHDQGGGLGAEDGTAWWGEAFGDASAASGEVVFNTAMTGYQEIASDASYNGQVVVLTYPLIGNYGTFERSAESRRPWVEALVVRELNTTCREDTVDLDAYLRQYGVPGISGVDTRALVRRLRRRHAAGACCRRPGMAQDRASSRKRRESARVRAARSATTRRRGERRRPTGRKRAKDRAARHRGQGEPGPLPRAPRCDGSGVPRDRGRTRGAVVVARGDRHQQRPRRPRGDPADRAQREAAA